MELRKSILGEENIAIEIINMGKAFLKSQSIDQWQTGYPDFECRGDIEKEKGYFLVDGGNILAYLCIDFDGEPAYENLDGAWNTEDAYVVVHRMAMSDKARGRNASVKTFKLVENLAKEKGVFSFRVDTDEANKIMQKVLEKPGFSYTGTISFDNSVKIAFDKVIV